MTTFSVGQMVKINPKRRMSWQPEGKFAITKVENVPLEDIEYNELTCEGGVGHHQVVWINYPGHPGPYSGLWFED